MRVGRFAVADEPWRVRIAVSLDPALADAYPRKRAANVTVRLKDGRVLERHQPTRKGDPDMPLSDGELSAKFRELAGPAVGSAATETLLDALWTGHALPQEVVARTRRM